MAFVREEYMVACTAVYREDNREVYREVCMAGSREVDMVDSRELYREVYMEVYREVYISCIQVDWCRYSLGNRSSQQDHRKEVRVGHYMVEKPIGFYPLCQQDSIVEQNYQSVDQDMILVLQGV